MKVSTAALALLYCLLSGTPARSQCPGRLPPAVLSTQYFPPAAFDTAGSTAKENLYACTLSALTEPPLFAMRRDRSIQVYRFLRLASFHRPISVRLTINSNGTGSITARSVENRIGLLPKPASDKPKLILDTTTVIEGTQLEEAMGQLQHISFWSMATEDDQPPPQTWDSSSGGEESQWILEGLRGGEYHVVEKWSPKDKSYSKLFLYLLRLGKVDTTLY